MGEGLPSDQLVVESIARPIGIERLACFLNRYPTFRERVSTWGNRMLTGNVSVSESTYVCRRISLWRALSPTPSALTTLVESGSMANGVAIGGSLEGDFPSSANYKLAWSRHPALACFVRSDCRCAYTPVEGDVPRWTK